MAGSNALRLTVLLALTAVACTGENDMTAGSGSKQAALGNATMLTGYGWQPRWMSRAACLRAAAKYLGNEASDGWLYGATGYAFALNVHEAMCPSGPTAWPDHRCDELAANIGLKTTLHVAEKNDSTFPMKQQQFFAAVKQAIDGDRPCFGWEMDGPEHYPICGYDEAGNYVYVGFDNQPHTMHHSKLGDTGIGVAAVAVVQPCERTDDRKTVRDALNLAAELAAGGYSFGGKYHSGQAGYDAWIAALRNEELLAAEETVGLGNAYNAQCWAECSAHVVPFLAEAKKRLADEGLDPLFDDAIAQYATVADRLSSVARAFPFDAGKAKEMLERLRTKLALRKHAVAALTEAKAAEDKGLTALGKIVQRLGDD